jgi:hypothetical protein
VHFLREVKATWVSDGDKGVIRRDEEAEDFVRPLDLGDDPVRPGRRRLLGAELQNGSILAVEDGREVSWPVDLAKQREALARCESGWCLLWTGETYKPSPMLCGNRACPRCMRARVGRIAHRVVPILEAAVADKAAVYFLTLTQPVDQAEGALVLPHEQRRYIGDAPPGEVRTAVGGESLAGSYARWRDHFRSVRQDRATKVRWRRGLGGYVYGVEWTLRRKSDRGPVVPRWHCHGHVLAVVPRGGWRDFHATWNDLKLDWCLEAGAHPNAQDCKRVTPRDDQTWSSALLECCKYPLKVADMTVAAMVEGYASLRGTRPHHIGGAFHGQSEASAQEPWKSWLAAAPEPPSWPRLLVQRFPGCPFQVYTGQVREGICRWARDGSTELADSWEADARIYWAALQEARASAEVFDRALVDEDA